MKEPDQDRVISEILRAGETGELSFSVATYLDLLNEGLSHFRAKIEGEVSSVSTKNGHVYFTLKDKDGESSMNCIIWRSNYAACGLRLEPGLEIAASGGPNVYKLTGRLSFIAETVELVGEGALKQAYDKLKAKLEKEGLFAVASKKKMLRYPERIGLVTSASGAVIHDFLNNLGRFGYQIKFIDSRVEGQLAISELTAAIRSFRREDIDVLVIIRGGGSLESLQAFNNEVLVREIKKFPLPVVVGIGHDQDVPLASLAADVACSTPTAVTRVLNESWELARAEVRLHERDILNFFERALSAKKQLADFRLKDNFTNLWRRFNEQAKQLADLKQDLFSGLQKGLTRTGDKLDQLLQVFALNDPARQLKLGYSIVRKNGKVVREVREVKIGDQLDIILNNGVVESEIKRIKTNKNGNGQK